MNIKELNDIIERHSHWVKEDWDGWEEMRANLSGADLSEADLSGVNLSRANLSGANLSGADLYGADLSRANLSRADLSRANLYGADLSGADLSGVNLSRANLSGADLSVADLSVADLYEADLYGADLYGANLYGADLSRANLYGANLYGADLSRADLSRANLYGASLYGVDLSRAKNIPYIPISCPDSGSFIGWKKVKCKTKIGFCDGLVKLFIPSDAKRSSATTRKCRCDKATVLSLEIIDKESNLEIDYACSSYDPEFIYRVGDHIEIPNFDNDRFNECAPGIHFFINKQEAIDY